MATAAGNLNAVQTLCAACTTQPTGSHCFSRKQVSCAGAAFRLPAIFFHVKTLFMQRLFFLLFLANVAAGLNAQSLDTKSLREIGKKTDAGPTDTSAMISSQAAVLRFVDEKNRGSGSVMSDSAKRVFFDKNIPSVIGKTGMAPAFFGNLSLSFGDDKLSFSTGGFSDTVKRISFGGELSAAAPNGSRTVFKPGGSAPYDFAIHLKLTKENTGTKWYALDRERRTDTVSSVRNTWWNFSFTPGIAKQILFADDTLHKTRNPFTYEALISFNGIFNSFYFQRYVNKRILWSVGVGYGRFTNYSELDEVTLHKGRAYENVLSETETVSGRRGDYRIVTGPVVRLSLFKPLTDPFSFTNVHLGATLNSFGLGTSKHLAHATAGVYFSKWKSEAADDQPSKQVAKELFSVGLIASFKNLQNISDSNYAGKNLSIIVSAQIPLRFF